MDMATELADRVQGPVYTAPDAGYAQEIAAFNTAVVHAPEIVVGATSANDVVEGVRFARTHGYRVAVQGAGHGAYAPVSSGLFISTRRLTAVSIDGSAQVATVGAGVRWAAVVAAAAEHGLAPIAG